MSPQELISAQQKARAIIDQLPQRALVPDSRIDKWIETMSLREPDRLVWHATRQSGFSGSEVGTLVENRRGRRAHFGSARKLVLQKLFILAPDHPNEHMLRGIETEDLHRAKFMKLWNAERDEQAFEALSNARGRYSFLRYSPDDVVTIQGKRVLVDYKSPSNVGEEDQFDFDYQCQINLGADILAHIGLPADHGLLSRLSWQEWKCVGNWVEVDRHLQQEILESAHYYWTKHVLCGIAPDYVNRQAPADMSEEAKRELKILSARIVAFDEATDAIATERETAARQMKKVARDTKAVGNARVFSHNIKSVEAIHMDHLRDVLLEHGLDADAEFAALSDPTKFKHDKLIADLLEQGVDLDAYVSQRVMDVERVKARLAELNVPIEAVIEHQYDVRKSTAKNADVNAFKPQFTAAGIALRDRISDEALSAIGEKTAAALEAEQAAQAQSEELAEEDQDLLVM